MKTLLNLIFICFFLNSTFAQTNYYVSTTGSDVNDGSSSHPWATIEHAVDSVSNPASESIVINVADGVYDLSNNQIDINRGFTNLTILGQSTINTIVQSASDTSLSTSRVFKIYAGNTVTLKNMTIRNGRANNDGDGYTHGGGIFNLFGNLTIESCIVAGNVSSLTGKGYGVGISNIRGTLIVSNSTISHNRGPVSTTLPCYGGGIASYNGTAIISNSTISYNTAPGGGGIAIISAEGDTLSSLFKITNSTVSENRGYYGYGGIRISRWGSSNSKNITASFNSCTIFQNYAGLTINDGQIGGVAVNSDLVTAGIQVNIKNSIFAGNKSDVNNSIPSLRNIDLSFQNGIGDIISGGYNIIQNYNGQAISGATNNGIGLDPLLETLADNNTANGTQTCATPGLLVPSSPAIDQIPAEVLNPTAYNGAPYLDQRGAGINNNLKDIGAYEWYPNHALPVELTSFTTQLKNNKVILNWTTATEVNNYGFEVERRTSPKSPPLEEGAGEVRIDWEKIGFVNGNGTSNSPKEYSFIDDKLFGSSKFQYRLKQLDLDGQYEYSNIVEVNIGLPVKFELSQNYPNPFNPSTKIRYTIPTPPIASPLVKGRPEEGFVSLKVYDVLGNEVTTLVNEYKPAGTYEVEFNVAHESLRASGVYFYRLQAGSFVQTRKMILMK